MQVRLARQQVAGTLLWCTEWLKACARIANAIKCVVHVCSERAQTQHNDGSAHASSKFCSRFTACRYALNQSVRPSTHSSITGGKLAPQSTISASAPAATSSMSLSKTHSTLPRCQCRRNAVRGEIYHWLVGSSSAPASLSACVRSIERTGHTAAQLMLVSSEKRGSLHGCQPAMKGFDINLKSNMAPAEHAQPIDDHVCESKKAAEWQPALVAWVLRDNLQLLDCLMNLRGRHGALPPIRCDAAEGTACACL